jgi:hypothetical protein
MSAGNNKGEVRNDSALGTVRVKCPNLGCQRILAVPVNTRGKLVRCRQCATIVRIPEERRQEVEPAPAPGPESKAA